MNLLVLMSCLVVVAASGGKIESAGTKAASPYVNYGCQCDSLTFKDKNGRIQGNCKSSDETSTLWCYLPLHGPSSCTDVGHGQVSTRFPGRKWSYEACATPPPPPGYPQPPVHKYPQHPSFNGYPQPPVHGYPQAPVHGFPQHPVHGYPQHPVHGYPQPPVYGYPQPPVHGYPQPPENRYPQLPVHGYPQPPVHGYPQPPIHDFPQPPVHSNPQHPVNGYPQPPNHGYPQGPVHGYGTTSAPSHPKPEIGCVITKDGNKCHDKFGFGTPGHQNIPNTEINEETGKTVIENNNNALEDNIVNSENTENTLVNNSSIDSGNNDFEFENNNNELEDILEGTSNENNSDNEVHEANERRVLQGDQSRINFNE